MKPFLRWAGSKRLLLPKLASFWGQGFDRYVEPFAGSASLYFHLEPKAALLSDINADLMNCLQQIAANPRRVYEQFLWLPEKKHVYNTLRAINPPDLSPLERGVQFFYLNRYCFNGIYRTNLAGRFNVPFSGQRRAEPPSYAEVLAASRMLRRATTRCGDFESVLTEDVRKGDFVYLDPPYATTARRVFREYHPNSFSQDDLGRLSSALRQVDKRGAKFVLSYAYCPEALEHFGRWGVSKVFALRNISGFVADRRKAAEIIVSNIRH